MTFLAWASLQKMCPPIVKTKRIWKATKAESKNTHKADHPQANSVHILLISFWKILYIYTRKYVCIFLMNGWCYTYCSIAFSFPCWAMCPGLILSFFLPTDHSHILWFLSRAATTSPLPWLLSTGLSAQGHWPLQSQFCLLPRRPSSLTLASISP